MFFAETELSEPLFCGFGHGVPPVRICMAFSEVLFGGYPLQVLCPVVCFDVIDMVDMIGAIRSFAPYGSNKAVCKLLSSDVQISIRPLFWVDWYAFSKKLPAA